MQCVTIEILDDYVIEDLQTFTISIELSLAVSDVEVLTPTATVVIYDENGKQLHTYYMHCIVHEFLVC